MKSFCKVAISFILIVFTELASAQEFTKLNTELRTYLSSIGAEEKIPLLVEIDSEDPKKLFVEYQVEERLALPPLYSINIPANRLEDFSKNTSVISIDFSLQAGVALADTMLIQTNALQVQQVLSPLREQYTGKGVVLGVIDSGIELLHPDFQDSTGNTRVLYIWDQGVAFNPANQALNYNYGVEWDSSQINNGISSHQDKAIEFGHGSNVTGAAASNGLATGNFVGVAPEVNIISVATDFNKPNWLQTVVEATDYIFKKADSLNMPVVINASVGTYLGSRDGKDIAGRMIDQLIKQKSGRAFVCAAGNAATIPYHLQHEPQNDTQFTWFESHPSMFAGLGGVYFELWSDTADFNQMQFAFGADEPKGNNQFRFAGRSRFAQAINRLNQIVRDTIFNNNGQQLATVVTFTTQAQGRYKMEVAIQNPDSSYQFRFESTGNGVLDIWSSFSLLRHSNILKNNLPNIAQYPAMAKYKRPDSLQTLVSSFSCLPSVITVGNYVNRNTYRDVNGTLRNMGVTPGEISINSSLGPNRNGYLKPDISSAGDYMFAAGRLATINQAIQTNPAKVSQDSLHYRNGGTSMASPTVAGMVALLLEKCNRLNYSQIKNKLIASARADSLTHNLPNPKWGHGKADAFQLLSNEVFTASLNSNATAICQGDSLILGTNLPFQHYRWNTGDTTALINIKSAGSYFAYAIQSNSCQEPTDTLSLSVNSIPFKPSISQSNDTLFTNATGQIQWYINQNPIQFAKRNYHWATQVGNYYVSQTDSNGCHNNSDTVLVTVVGLEQHQSSFVSVFPNPADDELLIDLNGERKFEKIQLVDLNGKLIYERLVSNSEQLIRFNVSQINNGIYLLKLEGPQNIFTKKVIIQ